jgi:hypothetical protein
MKTDTFSRITVIFICALFVNVLIEGAALWRAGGVWEQGRWTAVEIGLASAGYCAVAILNHRRACRDAATQSHGNASTVT